MGPTAPRIILNSREVLGLYRYNPKTYQDLSRFWDKLQHVRIAADPMFNSSEDESKKRALARMAQRIAKESKTLPYRWGYFQGVLLIPWSLLCISLTISDVLSPTHYPWYLLAIALLMGLLGLPLAYGLLRKRAFALVLVYAMFGLTVLLIAVRVPTVVRHCETQKLSASFDAELLVIWLLSVVYYRRRKNQFH